MPTPSVPELNAKPGMGSVFPILRHITAPTKVRQHWINDYAPAADVAAPAEAQPLAVRVLAQKRVGGLDATILSAQDTKSLGLWLHSHGYQSTPALLEWIQPYLTHHWIITAFKIDRVEKGSPLTDDAIRMSFKSEQPFYPYLEPKSQRMPDERLLHVYYFDLARASATTLTEFSDYSTVRPSDGDLIFTRAADQSIVERYRDVYVERPLTKTPSKSESPASYGFGTTWIWIAAIAIPLLIFGGIYLGIKTLKGR